MNTSCHFGNHLDKKPKSNPVPAIDQTHMYMYRHIKMPYLLLLISYSYTSYEYTMYTRQDKYYILTTASAGRGYTGERRVHFL